MANGSGIASRGTGFTPGPWVAFMGSSVQTEQGKFICTTVSFGKSAPKEAVFNARLIAAAPELLAEVKEFRRTVAFYLKNEKTDPEGARLRQIKLAMLDALIEKAGALP